MLSKKNTFNKKNGIKPVLDQSLTKNIGTLSSKSITKLGNATRLDISNSIIDISSDHSFEGRRFSYQMITQKSPPHRERSRNKNQYRTGP